MCVRGSSGSDERSRKLCKNPLRNDCTGKKTEFQPRWSTPWRGWTKFEHWSVRGTHLYDPMKPSAQNGHEKGSLDLSFFSRMNHVTRSGNVSGLYSRYYIHFFLSLLVTFVCRRPWCWISHYDPQSNISRRLPRSACLLKSSVVPVCFLCSGGSEEEDFASPRLVSTSKRSPPLVFASAACCFGRRSR